TKTSSPFSVVMKPNPFASLNHLTVPVCFMGVSPFRAADRSYPRHITSFTAHNHLPLSCIPARRGIGDLGDLIALRQQIESLGGRFVATLPINAIFADDDLSPYSPVSRLFWNEL